MSAGEFEFDVSEPVKIGQSGLKLSYWKYRVNTTTTYPQYTRREYGTYRRYNDFAWLRKRLIEMYPGCLVPPLPEKDVKENLDKLFGAGEETTAPLHRFRQRALRKFLVRVGAHPKLAVSTVLQEFIELSEDELEKRMKENPKGESILKSGSQFKQLSMSVSNKLSSDIAALKSSKTEDYPPERQRWHDVQQYLIKLENSLAMMRDRFEAVARKKRSIGSSFADAGRAFSDVLAAEAKMEGSMIDAVSTHTDEAMSLDLECAQADVTQIVETLTYYVGLCRAAEGVVEYLKSLWILEAVLGNDLDSLRKKREKGGTREQTDAIDQSLTAAMAKKDEVTAHIETTTKTLTDDLARFELEKQHDIKSLLMMNVDLTKEFSEKRSKLWETALPRLSE